LVTVGGNFYGIFSANNTPDQANFPNGVKYQRNANFLTKTLLDLSGNPVPVSYDPFHYQIRWHEEEREHREASEGHDIKYEAVEMRGLR
jgi:hypothetical protein